MDRTNAERQARWPKRQKELIEAAKRADAASTATIEELARADACIANLESEIIALRRALASPSATRAPTPLPEPDREVARLTKLLEQRNKTIKELQRRLQKVAVTQRVR